MSASDTSSNLLHLLNAYWLRPETAIWRACDMQAMADFQMVAPSLDFGCGDGVFSFIRAGGGLRDDFDVFRSVSNLDKFFQGIDVYDYCDDRIRPAVNNAAAYKMNVGFDHKNNLLQKADMLGFYSELVLGDGNRPLPFPDGHFRSIFSNIVYWLDDPKSVLREISRVLAPGGKACLFLPNDNLPDFSFYNRYYRQTSDERFQFLELLDRGRLSDNIKQTKSDSEWRAIFADSGLSVVKHVRHLSGPIVQIWDVGLRPLFPILKKMIDSIPGEALPPLKQEWVDICLSFGEPLVKLDPVFAEQKGATFHCYTLDRLH